jgi:hypothetical protein
MVFITEMKSVYSAVRIGSLNTRTAVCSSSLKDFKMPNGKRVRPVRNVTFIARGKIYIN